MEIPAAVRWLAPYLLWSTVIFILAAGAGYALVLADGRTFPVFITWVGAGAVTYEGLGPGPVDPAGRAGP